jgi:threonine/homoserine/homoserine lactone efflux protein
METHTWLVYLVAVTGLSLTPGPNGLLALTHGALYGTRKAIFTVIGGVLGFTFLIAMSLFGLGALLQASSHALLALKWIGGAYLVWLGFQLWRAPSINLESKMDVSSGRRAVLFRQGLLSAITNPKVLLFYGAFLPQFIDVRRALLPQFVAMALTFAVVEFVVEYLLASLAHRIRPRLERSGKRFNRFCGTVFVLFGAALPATQ